MTLLLLLAVFRKEVIKTLAGDHPFQAGEDAAAGSGLHLDSIFHEKHGTDLCANGLARIQFDFDRLNVVAQDAVINIVCHGSSF